MSQATADHHEHSPHLAHHFDSHEQQYASAKLGMWVFLGTEILMFGGLFCAYGVYRYSHPEVFIFAHNALDPMLGGINTAVLIASSFTMALAVRCAQLGQKSALITCLLLTILGGAGFMVIKTIEYQTKWKHHLFPGKYNVYNMDFGGKEKRPESLSHHEEGHPTTLPAAAPTTRAIQLTYADAFAGTPDQAVVKPPTTTPAGLTIRRVETEHHTGPRYSEMAALDQTRVNTFFSIYFCMTGLHGFHVLIGMGLMVWVLIRARRNEFGPMFFTPVDLVGLYWHLVDLIWIFLFPLLYLIH